MPADKKTIPTYITSEGSALTADKNTKPTYITSEGFA